MTDISADNASRIADGLYSHDAVDYPNTLEEFAAEGHHVIYALRAHIDALEASNKALVEALEWQSEVIDNAITENEIGGHRLFLDDEYHMGPVVDWVHTILTGFSKINRAATKELKHD